MRQYNNVKKLLIAPHFLPSLSFYRQIYNYDKIYLDCGIYYEKQSFWNRCYIPTIQGEKKIVIPIIHSIKKVPLRMVKVDYSGSWHKKTERTISTIYGSAPYYFAVCDLLFPILIKKHKYLIDINLEVIEVFKRFLSFPIQEKIDSYKKKPPIGVEDVRSVIHPKRECSFEKLHLPKYYSPFENKVTWRTSLIDILFYEGTSSSSIFSNDWGK